MTNAIRDAIRELGEVPACKLYTIVMRHMTLETFEGIIRTLERSGDVRQRGYVLLWTGGKSTCSTSSSTQAW